MNSSNQDTEMVNPSGAATSTGSPRPKPWRDEGYPAFSQWMSSSEDFLVLRRFGHLNARVLLLMQDRIIQLEESLADIDAIARQSPDEMADSSSLRDDPQVERTRVLDRLIVMLKNYNEYLATYSQVKGWRSAQKYHLDNVENWFWNHRGAIADVDVMVFGFIISLGLLLLLGPMWALQFVTDNVKQLTIITVFILIFTALLSSATVAKPFEVLAATAAYAAVLMVFLQMGGNQPA
ncbi:hypothetical protein BJ170DRAFT_727234 [Xylariales sp. AK1849]|nr:hypothetical protein BJ170DRAFT_727234 [Xylariales sp. AK1849]